MDDRGHASATPATRQAVEQETERVRTVQDKQAPKYDRQISFFERILFGDGRDWVCSQARGEVLELACGTARNLPFYRDDVKLTGIELSPGMLAIARQRAEELGHPADLRLGDVQTLEFPDESFDTVTCTLGFCTIPDTRAAAAEAFRVLRPGGRLLLLEHVRSPAPIVTGGQRLLEPLAVRFEADHLLRDPLDYLPGVGFEIDEVRSSHSRLTTRQTRSGVRGPPTHARVARDDPAGRRSTFARRGRPSEEKNYYIKATCSSLCLWLRRAMQTANASWSM